MIALIGVLVTAIMAAVYIWQPTFLVFLNQKTYDTLFRFVGQAAPSGRVAVVYVDEASVARYGQWPWPHYRLARLLGGIADLGAAAVAVDFLLGEPDRTSLSVVRRDMARELGVNFQVEGLPDRFQDNDRILAEALSRGPFVLGMKFLFGSAAPPDKEPCVLKPPAVVIRAQGSQPPPPAPWFRAGGALCSIPVVARAAGSQGFMNAGLDGDGVLRRVPLLIEYQGRLYPSLALAVYLRLQGLKQVIVHRDDLGAQAVQVRRNLIPVDAHARLLVNFRGPAGTFHPVSAAAILEGTAPPQALAGKAVLVGISAGGLQDQVATPLDTGTPGVEIQAHLLDNLIQRDYISSPAYTPGLELGLVVLCGLASAWFLTRLRALGNLGLVGGGAALLVIFSAWYLKRYGLYWSPLWPMLTLGVNFSLLNLARFWWEEQQVKSRTRELTSTVSALRTEVSERERAEEALVRSEERFRVLSEESPLGIAVVDSTGRYEYLNPTFERIFGYGLRDFSTGREWFRLAFPDRGERHQAIAAWLGEMSPDGPGPLGVSHSFEVTCRDGGRKTILFRPVSIPQGKHFILYEDITQRIKADQEMRQLEDKLYQSQKMEALGVLAGGIAHDFNNVLQAISGYVQLISAAKDTSALSRERLEKVGRSADRAAGMIKQLMTMARKVETRSEPVDLNQEVEQTVSVLEHTLPRMIDIRVDLDQGLEHISGDPGQMEQVLLNLATNAWHAMPQGGELSLVTRNAALTAEDCKTLPGLGPGRYVILEVRDTGLGMDEETRRHIFEPFFTTKPLGEGTGLGLSTVYGIVISHGGQIYCRSRSGRGTIFTLYFPAMPGLGQSLPGDRPAADRSLGGSETILVVDDEEAILESCREALKVAGYRVLTAGSGEKALETFQRHPGEVSLVILDLNMPGMGGLKCLEALLAVNPQAKVMVATGYADQEVEERIKELGGAGLISKPYRFTDLMSAVRGVLDG